MFIGNLSGPTTEGVIQALSATLLSMGCPREELEMDIALETQGSQEHKVLPAKLDENGRPFVEFSIQGKLITHFVDDHPSLKGPIDVEKGGTRSVAEEVASHQWRLKI